ncbi:MAG TPA: hypothetical protein PKX93_03785 [bacterium]|nr:hypothetical protein [bacterium]HOL66561.1 hypothetical protein [bacterium]HPP11166.1 hypothetical protein [bacterium]
MPVYCYRARTEKGRIKTGLLRSPDRETGWQFLQGEGLKPLALRGYFQPDYQAIIVTALFFIVLIPLLVATLPGQITTGHWLEGFLQTGIVIAVLTCVLTGFRVRSRQTLARRTLSFLDRPSDSEESYFLKVVSGQFLPEEKPQPVLVEEGGFTRQRVVVGKVERTGWPAQLHLVICVAGYYLSSFLLWCTLSAAERTAFGKTIPCWGLALGLSLLPVPALMITSGLKLRLPAVVITTSLATFVQFWWLRSSYFQKASAAPVYLILVRHPFTTVAAWVLPVAVMIYLNWSPGIKKFLDLEAPVYEEEK